MDASLIEELITKNKPFKIETAAGLRYSNPTITSSADLLRKVGTQEFLCLISSIETRSALPIAPLPSISEIPFPRFSIHESRIFWTAMVTSYRELAEREQTTTDCMDVRNDPPLSRSPALRHGRRSSPFVSEK
jgi:hypothetical protein